MYINQSTTAADNQDIDWDQLTADNEAQRREEKLEALTYLINQKFHSNKKEATS